MRVLYKLLSSMLVTVRTALSDVPKFRRSSYTDDHITFGQGEEDRLFSTEIVTNGYTSSSRSEFGQID